MGIGPSRRNAYLARRRKEPVRKTREGRRYTAMLVYPDGRFFAVERRYSRPNEPLTKGGYIFFPLEERLSGHDTRKLTRGIRQSLTNQLCYRAEKNKLPLKRGEVFDKNDQLTAKALNVLKKLQETRYLSPRYPFAAVGGFTRELYSGRSRKKRAKAKKR